MTKLSDLQCILLSTAAARNDGSLFPLPQSVSDLAGTAKAIKALITRSLIQEREASDAVTVHRSDGDLHYALHIMAAGLAAIGVEPNGECGVSGAGEGDPAPTSAPKRETKVALVVGLLQRTSGATLLELIEATGWLPHTTRAALTGLRKKGHAIVKGRRDDVTCYSIAAVA